MFIPFKASWWWYMASYIKLRGFNEKYSTQVSFAYEEMKFSSHFGQKLRYMRLLVMLNTCLIARVDISYSISFLLPCNERYNNALKDKTLHLKHR